MHTRNKGYKAHWASQNKEVTGWHARDKRVNTPKTNCGTWTMEVVQELVEEAPLNPTYG
jgi:hypothetical protein